MAFSFGDGSQGAFVFFHPGQLSLLSPLTNACHLSAGLDSILDFCNSLTRCVRMLLESDLAKPNKKLGALSQHLKHESVVHKRFMQK